jgi:hypothetical protein
MEQVLGERWHAASVEGAADTALTLG